MHAEIAEGAYVGYSRHYKSTNCHSRSCNPKDAGSNASRERGLEAIQAPHDAGANSRGTERLQSAILLCEDGTTPFATLHGVTATADAAPQLTAGRAVTTAFLHTLAAGLKREVRPEILPANLLVRSAEAIAWWTRGCRRPMFFRDTDAKSEGLNGKVYPHPALVFLISGKDLYVRALGEDT